MARRVSMATSGRAAWGVLIVAVALLSAGCGTTGTSAPVKRLGAELEQSIDGVTPAAVAGYYAAHRDNFSSPEQRYVQIDSFTQEQQARHALDQVHSGVAFSQLAGVGVMTRGRARLRGAGAAANERLVFSVRPGVLVGPIPWRPHKLHALIKIIRVVPATVSPLHLASYFIRATLLAQSIQSAMAAYLRRVGGHAAK